MKKVLVFAPGYPPAFRFGGPVRTLASFVERASPYLHFWVVAPGYDLGCRDPLEGVSRGRWETRKKEEVLYLPRLPKGFCLVVSAALKLPYDYLYLNSFFSVVYCLLPLAFARVRKKRVILAPRGQFSPHALSYKTGRKRAYIAFWRLLKLHEHSVWQASSEIEARQIRAVFENADVRVAPDVCELRLSSPRDEICCESCSPLRLVFLSRISPIKNLDYLLDVLAQCRSEVDIDVYGPLEDKVYWRTCLEAAAALPLNVRFSYKGELEHENVHETLGRYDAFVLPTKTENFGHAIVEAWCAALPVIISDRTPWLNLESSGAGWDIPLTEPARFVAVIDHLGILSPQARLEVRKRAAHWASTNFANDAVLMKNLQLFGVRL